jgi:hypothetical protein
MNFVGTLQGAEGNIELKYCERCGGLFLRTPGAGVVYCGGCTSWVANQPALGTGADSAARRKNRSARLKNGPAPGRKLHGSARIEYLHGVAAAEVRSW